MENKYSHRSTGYALGTSERNDWQTNIGDRINRAKCIHRDHPGAVTEIKPGVYTFSLGVQQWASLHLGLGRWHM